MANAVAHTTVTRILLCSLADTRAKIRPRHKRQSTRKTTAWFSAIEYVAFHPLKISCTSTRLEASTQSHFTTLDQRRTPRSLTDGGLRWPKPRGVASDVTDPRTSTAAYHDESP
jgi:hypothetical protein